MRSATSHVPPRAAETVAAIDAVVRRHDLLQHPFYVAWSAGELSRDDLGRYAAAYRWPVLALAAVAELAADSGHAREEYAHVALSDDFARACGGYGRQPGPAAADCALIWLAGRDRLEQLATLYAIESMQPPIAAAKLDGLLSHYGFDEGPATEYFRVHRTRDFVHAAVTRRELLRESGPRDGRRLVARARAVVEANWQLLTAVHAAA